MGEPQCSLLGLMIFLIVLFQNVIAKVVGEVTPDSMDRKKFRIMFPLSVPVKRKPEFRLRKSGFICMVRF